MAVAKAIHRQTLGQCSEDQEQQQSLDESIMMVTIIRLTTRKAVRFAEAEHNTCIIVRKKEETKFKQHMFIQQQEHQEATKKMLADVKDFESRHCNLHLEGIYDCSVPDRIDRLVHLHRDAAPARGLERLVSSEHGAMRMVMRRRTIQAVLSRQQKEQQPVCSAIADREAALASVSQGNSHAARVFARVMGLADQRIVREELGHIDVEAMNKPPLSSSSSNKANLFRRSFSDMSDSSASRRISKMVKRISFKNSPKKQLLVRRTSPKSTIEEMCAVIRQEEDSSSSSFNEETED